MSNLIDNLPEAVQARSGDHDAALDAMRSLGRAAEGHSTDDHLDAYGHALETVIYYLTHHVGRGTSVADDLYAAFSEGASEYDDDED